MSGVAQGAIRVEGVHRTFRILRERNQTLKETLLRRGRSRYTEFAALTDVSLEITPGESVGLVGRNGSGKSTLLKLIAGIIEPTAGRIVSGGTIASMLELGAGFHPDFSGRENLFLNASILGFGEREVRQRFDEIVEFAELEDFIDAPVRTYSSGMQLRLAFAVASHVRADIMLLDEVFAVGDEAFQRKCMGKMFDFRKAGGTLVFVSHDPSAVERICERAVLMEAGHVLDDGDPLDVLAHYHRVLAKDSRRAAVDGRAEGFVSQTEATDGRADDDQDSERWGSREVEIVGVRLLDGTGTAAEAFESGGPLTIEMDFMIHASVPFPNFGIAIHSAEGVACYGTNMAREGWDVPAEVTQGAVRFLIPALHLHEGRFMVTVAATSHDEREVYDWHDRCLGFSVFAQGRGVGLVDLGGSWALRAGARAG